MPQVDPNSLFQRTGEITLTLLSDNTYRVNVEGGSLKCHQNVLSALEVFSRPVTFHGALEALKTRTNSIQEWIDLTTDIQALIAAGVLVDTSQAGSSAEKALKTPFDNPRTHIAMINDEARTRTYLEAIREVVRPGDVVVEIGTGTGILSIAAAQAGAKHIYAIEAGRIADVAEANFAANGFAQQITLIRGWSHEVTLPERADVLISEIIGNDIWNEGVLDYTRDAHKRLLKPDARLVPDGLQVFALPIHLSDQFCGQLIPVDAVIDEWYNAYGIKLSGLQSLIPSTPLKVKVIQQTLGEWTAAAEPLVLLDIALKQPKTYIPSGQAAAVVQNETLINAIIIYFELKLGSRTLSQHPSQITSKSHWPQLLWLLPQPLHARRGQIVDIHYDSGNGGKVRAVIQDAT